MVGQGFNCCVYSEKKYRCVEDEDAGEEVWASFEYSETFFIKVSIQFS